MAKVEYPGKLGRRSNDMPPVPPPTSSMFDAPSESAKSEHEEASREWVTRQVLRMLEGITQLLDYYEIEDSEDRFAHLAFALARDHVPYCMTPVPRRGRPKKTQQIIPVVDDMANLAKTAGLTQKSVYEVFAKVLKVDVSTVTREVKRYRSKKNDGENRK